MATLQSIAIFCTIFCVYFTLTQAYDDADFDKLLKRIEALESRDRIQQELIVKQERLLQQYEDKLEEYSDRIEQLESGQIPVVHYSEGEQEPAPSNVDSSIANAGNKMNDGVMRKSRGIVNVHATHKLPRLVLDNGEGPIAFHATHDTGVTPNIGQDQHILFEDVHINAGNSFHEQQGLFIAPRAGLYLFSVSIMAAPDGTDVIAAIIKDGTTLAKAYAAGASLAHDQGSVTVVTQLTMGQEVWVSSAQRASVSDYGDLFTSFMGCLLSEF